MAVRSLQFLDIDGFWGERKTNEERYYSDSFIKYVIVIEGFNECVLFSTLATRFMYEGGKRPTIQDGWRPKTPLESVDIASQQTHCEPTNAIDDDVTPTGKGLDKAN